MILQSDNGRRFYGKYICVSRSHGFRGRFFPYGCSSFRSISRDHMRSIPHDPYPFRGHDPYLWSIPMIHTSVIANPGHVLVLFLTCTYGILQFLFHALRFEWGLFDLYDLIRRHDVAPELTRQNFETRGYVHKVSNPLPVPDPACSLLLP
jgi:hypothetical protein